MIIIPAIQRTNDGVITNLPSLEIPANAVLVVFDGTDSAYTVYEQGDELPPEPANVSE